MSATLTTLVGFDGPNGEEPTSDLIADAAGDLFGTTNLGGASGGGTVFEIAKTAGGYANTPATLVSFNGADGTDPERSLIADSNGDLFGTTYGGGEFGYGTVFEVTKTATGYASTPTILVSFNGADGGEPFSSLVADADGDLFGTTSGIGVDDDGTVFEIVKTLTGYASTPTTLASFNGANGAEPEAGLIADADGDLFGTTLEGGANDDGTVFEIVKTLTGYASTPTTLASFNGVNGTFPTGLIADSDGDLFGTTVSGGAYDYGTVFEIKKTAGGYASAPITLVSFGGGDSGAPGGTLVADANGDLFGTMLGSGSADGAVFEIKNTPAGYVSAPIIVATFNLSNGSAPAAGVIADANGDLFGTTAWGGQFGDGTLFEVTDSGFMIRSIVWRNASTGGVELWSPNGSGGFTYEALAPVNTSWQIAGTGDFAGGGEDGILWRNASTGGVELWNANGSGGFTCESLNPVNTSWQVAGTGDFTGSGDDDILWRNASTGGVELWNSNGWGAFTYQALNPVNTSWQIAGTGDFTGSGDDSILWRNASSGGVELWNPNGSGGFTYEALNPVNTNWQVAGTGDFTGSGDDSILWRNASTGGVELWNPNGSGGFTYEALNPVNTSWQVAATGDFTGSGEASILWRNASTGGVELWSPKGSGGFAYDNLGVVSASWTVAGHL